MLGCVGAGDYREQRQSRLLGGLVQVRGQRGGKAERHA